MPFLALYGEGGGEETPPFLLGLLQGVGLNVNSVNLGQASQLAFGLKI